MNYSHKILFQVLVKPFYRENKGTLVFIFTMMFFIVSKQSGAGLYAYHYSLVTGMLSSTGFLITVLFTWFLYARKCVSFVSDTVCKPAYGFMHVLNCVGAAGKLSLFLFVQIWMMMPVLLYTIFIISVALQQHFYVPLFIILFYLLLLCVAPAVWYVLLLNNPRQLQLMQRKTGISSSLLFSGYRGFLAGFITNRQKMLWTGIKVFTCGMLYLNARNNSPAVYDSSYAFIFYIFGILAHGVIIYRVRHFEETQLAFYRGLPVPLFRRMMEYAFFYFVLLIPEFLVAGLLTPDRIHYADAVNFSLCSYILLLLMNSITFLQNFSMKDYLKILLLLFFVVYVFFMAFGLTLLYIVFLVAAIMFFVKGYYSADQSR